MKQITVITGYGYYKKDGNIVMKATLPQGNHPIDDEFDYFEVDSKEELDLIEVYAPPKTDQEIYEEKIRDKIKDNARKQAIKDLKQSGELPDDYE